MKRFILHTGFFASLLAGIILPGCQKETSFDHQEQSTSESPVTFTNGEIIPGKYIVVFKDAIVSSFAFKTDASYEERNLTVREAARPILQEKLIDPSLVEMTYNSAIVGFTAKLDARQHEALLKDSRIAYIEQDRFISLAKPGGGGSPPPTQTEPWGVTRVGKADASGKVVWIIDTGVDQTHPDLNVDNTRSKSFVGGTPNDGNGHGTHVAGTIAAKNNTIGVIGVAYNATVVGVKVLNNGGTSSTSSVVGGLDYAAASASAGDVANMSLGGSASTTIDNAVLNLASKGVRIAIAAGNSSNNAANYSPARVNHVNVFTISAMGTGDNWASFSNYGNPPVDYCAPGAGILSTYKGGGYATLSGTSMATPHVAGLLLITSGSLHTGGTVNNDPDGNPDLIVVK